MFSENAICLKTKGCAVIQTPISDRTNVFFSNDNYVVQKANYFYTRFHGNVKIVHFPHFHDISYGHNTLSLTNRVGKKPGFFVINRKNPFFLFKPGFIGFYGFNGFYGFFSVYIFL